MDYFYNILIFVMGTVIGGVAVLYFLKNKSVVVADKPLDVAQDSETLREKQIKEKEVGKQKILELFDSQARVLNDDVQKMLGVSDASATRYLDELEKEGKIKQVGEIGSGVFYQKT